MIKGINKWKGPNRSRRDSEEVARTHRTIQKMSNDPDNHNGVSLT